MATVTSFTSEYILELISDFSTLSGNQQNTDLAVSSLSNSMAVLNSAMDDLNNVELPALHTALDENQASLDDLNNVQLPALQSDLADNASAIDTLNTTTLPALDSRLDNNDTAILTLNNTTIPDLNSRLGTAESSVSSLSGKFPVTAPDIAAGAVTANAILADAVTANAIAAGAVVAAKIATDAVTANKILAGAVVAGKIATDAVTANTILAGAVVAGKIATDAVTANTILAGAVVAGKIATDAVTANTILAGAVVAGKIATDAVTANTILAGAVVAGKIDTDAVTANNIAANAITAKHSLTGPLIRTGASGIRVEISPSASGDIRFYNNGDALAAYIDYYVNPQDQAMQGVQVVGGSGAVKVFNGGVNIEAALYGLAITGNMTLSGAFFLPGGTKFNSNGTLDMNGGSISGLSIINGGPTINGSIIVDSLKDGGTNNSNTGTKYVRAGANGTLYSYTTGPSSKEIKHDYGVLDIPFRQILSLQSSTYRFNEAPNVLRAGFFAEDAHEKGLGLFVGYEDDANPEKPMGFDYDGFDAALLYVDQEQQKIIDDHETKLQKILEYLKMEVN